MASSPSTLIHHSFSQRFPPFTHSFKRIPIRIPSIKASSNEPESENDKIVQTESEKPSKPLPTTRPKKPIYSMKKGQIVRVDKEKYLDSINYLSVGHPPYYKGLDYIYEDRGEVLDIRNFETGEYALFIVKPRYNFSRSNSPIFG
ncbi:uncharacterized protein LOC143857487 isoform X2 [Tasmannia lanceolata]|uniref:uncharacterized protein LOC143857487 isoform X2 n=1 Tax=Tasmannia lanceolata TaxID=3420 RepID=UPI004064A860